MTTFSPTATVRKSCRSWMDGDKSNDANLTTRKCSVFINNDALDHFAMEITSAIIANKSLAVSEWDAEGWHYTGERYRENSNKEFDILMRMERVALYVLTMDAINFCFWPSSKKDVKNCLEYEHLAIALRKVAERDDDDKYNDTSSNGDGLFIFRAASTYALSPTNLSTLTSQQLEELLLPHLPMTDQSSTYEIPDIDVRCQLLNELGRGILNSHNGSALSMIAKSNNSADSLAYIILDTFPGFRDFVDEDGDSQPSSWEAAKKSSAAIHFYKRSQIAVADIWAALGRNSEVSNLLTNATTSKLLTCCQFTDMDSITTFPDYRVPQILRHVNVIKYDDELAHKVDSKTELCKGCHDEISIRAGTVVAVDDLVCKVKDRLVTIASNADGEGSKTSLLTLANDVSAVTLDWYLWQQGEKLDRQNLLQPHHRVRTTFY